MGDNNVEAPPAIASSETNMNVFTDIHLEVSPSTEIAMVEEEIKLLEEQCMRMEFVYF